MVTAAVISFSAPAQAAAVGSGTSAVGCHIKTFLSASSLYEFRFASPRIGLSIFLTLGACS